MLKKTKTTGIKKGLLVALFFMVWVVYGCLNVSVTQAENAWAYQKDTLRKGNNVLAAEIYSGTPTGSGNLAAYKNATSIGFDTLYGSSQRDNRYTGDVPGSIDSYKDYPHFSSEWLGDRYRTWWKDPTSVQSYLKWEDNGTDDIHAAPLTHQTNLLDALFAGFTGILFFILGFLNAPISIVLNIIINISNFDVSSVSSLLNLDELTSTIAKTFTMDNAGNISPLLVIALAIFMIGLAGLIIKRIFQGESANAHIGQEIVYLLISFLLIAVGFTGGYGRLITLAGNATTTLVSNISSSSGDHMRLFEYNTGNITSDANSNDIGMTAKTYIDIIIHSQFGCPSDELDLWGDPDTTQNNWSISEADMRTLVRNLTKHDGYAGDENLFAVSTGGYSNTERPNVGYWWYAVDSGVNPSNPFYLDENGNVVTNRIDVRQGVFVMDLMAAIHAQAPAGSLGAQKSLKIIDTFFAHEWQFFDMFLCILVSLALCFALAIVSVFSLVFKLIFNIGFILVPLIPIFLLIPKTRDIAKKLLFTWLSATIIFVMCLVISKLVLYVSTILCNAGGITMVLDIVILIMVGWQAPKIVQILLATPHKMQMEGFGPTETFIQQSSTKLGEFHRATHGQRDFADRARTLREQEAREDRLDKTTLFGSEKETHTSFDNILNTTSKDSLNNKFGIQAQSLSDDALWHMSDTNYNDKVKILESKKYEELKQTTAGELAAIYEMSDAETMRSMGMDNHIVKAKEHMEKNENKRKLKKQELEKRRRDYRAKRIAFYEKLDTVPMKKLAATRLGAFMISQAVEFEEKTYKRKEKHGYKSIKDSVKNTAHVAKHPVKNAKNAGKTLKGVAETNHARLVLKKAEKQNPEMKQQIEQHKAKLSSDVKQKFDEKSKALIAEQTKQRKADEKAQERAERRKAGEQQRRRMKAAKQSHAKTASLTVKRNAKRQKKS